MGVTGVGKSMHLIFLLKSLTLPKFQVYKGLNTVLNKIFEFEKRCILHHLLEVVDSDFSFFSHDFCFEAILAMEKISNLNKIPIIDGGSNSFIETSVENFICNLKSNYESWFIWLDVSLSTLHSNVSKRVDQMCINMFHLCI